MQPPHPVEVLASRTALRTKIFDLVEARVRLPSGLEQELVVVEHPGAVCVAPLLPDGRLLLVRQYRHATGEWLLEIPAGRLEQDEGPEEAARRELEEETGHRAGTWEPLSSFYAAPGFCSERLHLFLARDLEELPGGGLPADEDEELELVRLAPEALLEVAADAKTLLAATLLLLRRRS